MTAHARVAVLSTFYHPVHGGAETAARRLAIFLAGRGHAVQVITKRTDAALPDRDTVDGVPVERVGAPGPRRGAGKWTVIPAAARSLWGHRDSYDVICAIDYRGIGLAALAVGGVLHRPVVIQAQTEGVLSCANLEPAAARVGLSARSGLVRALTWPLRRAYRSADAVACISRAIEREAIAEGVPRERIHYLPNTVDTRRFHPPAPGEREALRSGFGWTAGPPIGIFVGRLSREKGIADLVSAMGLIRSDARLMVVGPDMAGHPWDEGANVRRMLAADARLAARVRLLGPTDDPAPLYRAADFAVVPSHWESFGISAAEAMASGLPVIASAVGGLTDFIVTMENGVLVPPHDPPALAAAIDRVAADPALRARLGAAAVTAMAAFDEPVVLERFGALVDALAGRA